MADLETALAVGTTFVAGTALAAGVRSFVLGRADPVRDRLSRVVRAESTADPLSLGARPEGRWLRFLTPIARRSEGQRQLELGEEAGQAADRLMWAGFRRPHALELYVLLKLALAFACGAAVFVLDFMRPLPRPLLLAGLATFLGFLFPAWILRSRIHQRQRLIRNALPDSLDLLVSCVEAGLALEGALTRVSQELHVSAPLLSQELMHTVHEVEAGIPRGQAFRRLASRTGVSELKSLAAILMQTEAFGTSVAKALRIMAEGVRVDRMQKAQVRAATVGVRLAIPLVLCLLPSLIMILMGNTAVRVVKFLMPVLKAG